MKIKAFLSVLINISILSTVALADAPVVKDGNRIHRAALDWLALLDSHEYGRSWEAASTLFKQSTQQQDWNVRIQGFRNTIGTLVYRKLYLLSYNETQKTRLSCTLVYYTQYSNRAVWKETVFLIYEEDAWLVAGYYVNNL